MKRRLTAAAALGAALLLSAGGCDITNLSKEDMLRPPKTMGDEAEIEKLISKTAKGPYTLKYPKSGSYRSAIVMHDINGDNVDEAIAFFRDKEGSAGVHMLVMYENDGKWNISADFVNESTDVDSLDFADIDQSSGQEILVGYATYATGVNFLTAYTFQNGTTNAIETNQNYSAFYCGNLDNSGKNKVITLSLFSPKNEAKATLLEYDSKGKTLFAKASAAMDPNIISYKNAVFTDLGDNLRGLVVDGALASGELNTQVIYFSKPLNILRNPLYKDKSPNPTQRSSAVYSSDINNDMKVKIPTVSTLPYHKSSGAFTAAEQVLWNNFSVEKETLLPAQRTAANYQYNYTINIPETWAAGSFSALLNEDGDVMTVCEWQNDTVGEKLFEVKVFKVAEWDKGKNAGDYVLLYKDNRYAYTFRNFHTQSSLALGDDEIKTAFSLLGGNSSGSGKNEKQSP